VPDNELAVVPVARLADQPPLGADEVRGAVEVVVAVLLDADPVDRADVVLVGDRRGGLLQLPQVVRQARARRARGEDDLRAVQAERPPPFREAPVVADVDADLARRGVEHRVTPVARPEVELLPEAGKVREVVLAVLAEVRPVGVDHRGRVVEKARLLDLVHRQDHDHVELGRELREALGDRAGHRLGVLVELRLLHLAEVRSVEELLEADHPGALRGGQPGLLLVVSDHAFLVARPDGLHEGRSHDRHLSPFALKTLASPAVIPIVSALERHDLTYGTPSARGPRTLPTRPATTMIVTTYGVSRSRFDWIGTLMLDRIDWSWVVKPNSRAAPMAPNGVYRPKIIAASAMYPSPEDMPMPNDPTEPIVKYAPPMPAMSPARITLRYRRESTWIPTVSAATGCSPTARVRSPQRVRNSPNDTPASTTYVM